MLDQKWQLIETAPKNYEKILCAFKGQFQWVIFVGIANGADSYAINYAKPTHWMPLPNPPDEAGEARGLAYCGHGEICAEREACIDVIRQCANEYDDCSVPYKGLKNV